MRHLKVVGLAVVAAFALSAIGASGASAALLALFQCDGYPCSVLAAVTGGVFKVGSSPEVKCTAGHFVGSLTAASEWLLVTPTYQNCKAFGVSSATVNMNGCNYEFHTDGTVDVEPAGCGPIKITSSLSTCEIQVPSQTGLKNVEYSEGESLNGHMIVLVKASVTKIKYKVGKTGIGCPGEGEEATYKEETTAEGKNGSGAALDILFVLD
jgi:hypothetical protein